MGLSNQYVGEIETYNDREKFSQQWFHKWANEQGLAFCHDEAEYLHEMATLPEGLPIKEDAEFGVRLKAECGDLAALEGEELDKVIRRMMDATAQLGRNLEQDEEEHLARNPGDIVIDV